MGLYLFDQYSLLHFAVGVLAYFWGFTFFQTMLFHSIFEVVENTNVGMGLINGYFANIWPGGKPYADSLSNSIGDTISVGSGWWLAYYLDLIGTQNGWYEGHLAK